MQLRHGLNDAQNDIAVVNNENGDCGKYGGCVVEALPPERFAMIRDSADIAEGYRRMIRFIIAGNNARAFLAGCQATKKNLDERLAMLLEPDMTPASRREALPVRGRGGKERRPKVPTSALA
jgi:hypothetical protein